MYLLNIESWGPAFWHVMHAVSFMYPENPTPQDQTKYANFYENLIDVLPCQKCRNHFAEILQEIPMQLRSRRELSEWVVNVHNEVNKSTGKPEQDYLDVVQAYMPPSLRSTVLDERELDELAEREKSSGGPSSCLWISIIIGSILAIILIVVLVVVCSKKGSSK